MLNYILVFHVTGKGSTIFSEAETRLSSLCNPQSALLSFLQMGTTLTSFQSSGIFLSHQSQICFCPFSMKNTVSFIRLQKRNCITSKITCGCHLRNVTQKQSNSFLQSSPLYQHIFFILSSIVFTNFCFLPKLHLQTSFLSFSIHAQDQTTSSPTCF